MCAPGQLRHRPDQAKIGHLGDIALIQQHIERFEVEMKHRWGCPAM